MKKIFIGGGRGTTPPPPYKIKIHKPSVPAGEFPKS